MANFIQLDQFLLKERFAIIKNTFDIYNDQGEVVAQAREKLTAKRIFLGLFDICFCDSSGAAYAYIEREFNLLRPTISVYDGNHRFCGLLKKKLLALKPCIRMYDAIGQEFGTIRGGFWGWGFEATSTDGRQLGTISKKFNGVLNEVFTTKDKYMVTLAPDLQGDQRIVVACAATVIDMLLHEANRDRKVGGSGGR